MREIVFDTETTGLDPATGDRIVEIGAVELWNHLPTGRTFHEYLDPERSMPVEAFAVHGLDDAFLRGKPKFAEIAVAFLAFIEDAPLIAHNAAFDMKFVNAELRAAGHAQLPPSRSVDTLAIARQKLPGVQASLDALCRRFGVDTSARDLHGALLDSQLLAEVYLELVGGRQPGLGFATERQGGPVAAWTPPPRPTPLEPRITDAEALAHAAFVVTLGPDALWLKGG